MLSDKKKEMYYILFSGWIEKSDIAHSNLQVMEE